MIIIVCLESFIPIDYSKDIETREPLKLFMKLQEL